MLPLSLYIHIPWCIQKCPYCDFNSHHSPAERPEMAYIDALIQDLDQDISNKPPREIHSIFIGGGTPSLFSAGAYDRLLNELNRRLSFKKNIEITLEANPGTAESQRFRDYRSLGINRLSLGIQSFQAKHLQILGRIHNDQEAIKAIEIARGAGFDNLNIDLMHSLPAQSLEEGLADLKTAMSFEPEHLSWYQLTIEPNTVFYKNPPSVPHDDFTADLEEAGFALLANQQMIRYETSAFSRHGKQAHHNMNYWLFGDYYGIGAGAHGKYTYQDGRIYRTQKHRVPKDYLNLANKACPEKKLTRNDICFEFMLNSTRLLAPIPFALFESRTHLPIETLRSKLEQAEQKGLIYVGEEHWQITALGLKFTNDLQALFL
jgi:putative oxygen-independent coproporphyrinogen III oxidase